MKKLLLAFTIVGLLVPAFTLAQTTCPTGQRLSADGTTCLTVVPITTSNTTGAGTTNPAATTNTTCPNNGQLINGVCNLGYTPLEPIPGVTDNSSLTTSGGFANLVNAIFKILITAGALIAVLSLTIGGVQYMTSSSVGNKTQGLDRARAAIYGILLIAATYLILNTINPQLLNFNFLACAGSSSTCTQSSINSFTQTTGFTTPNTASVQTVSASSVQTPAGTTQALNPIQYSNSDSNVQAVQQASTQFMAQCQSNQGSVILVPGTAPGTTAETCMVSPGLY